MKRSVLIRRLLSARRAQAATLLLAAFAIAATMTGLLTVRASAAQAVADATRTDHAGHGYAVQVLDDAVTPTFAARTDILPIWESAGSAATAARQTPTTVRAVNNPEATSGVLAEGRRPVRAGEATASAAVLRSLDAGIGDTITVTDAGQSQAVTVTGLTINPADRDDATVVMYADRDPRTATVWVSDTDVFDDPELRGILERRQAVARTVGILAEDREAEAIDSLVSALRYSAPAFALLAVCTAGIMLGALHRERRRDVLALAAAGMPTPAGWRLLAAAAAWCLTAGAALGAVMTLVGSYLLRDPVSALLGQQWAAIAVPWTALLTFLVLFAPGALLLARVVTRGAVASVAVDRIPAAAWTGGGLFLVGSGVLALMSARHLPVAYAPVAGVTVVIGATLLLAGALPATRRHALRRLVKHSERPLLGLALAAAVVTFSAGYYAARQEHTAASIREDDTLPQPAGSMFIYNLNAEASAALQQQYQTLGGRQAIRHLIPAEPTHQIRVTNARLVECLEQRGSKDPDELLADCGPDGTRSPINFVALTDEPATAGLRADKALVEQGRAGFLTFPNGTSLTSATAVESAQPDPILGGNVAGAVLGVDTPLAKRLKLVPSGAQSLLLSDFAALPKPDQATMRAAIARTASTAEVSEYRDDEEAQFRAVATATAIGATAVVLLMLTTLGMTFLAAHRDLRRMLGHLGVNRGRRRAVGARLLLLPLGAQAVALAAARVSAWLNGIHDGSGFGRLWVVPGIVGIVVCVVLAVAYGRPPRSTTAGA